MSSAPVRFKCFACGGNVRALASQIGQSVQCPRCSAALIVLAENGTAPTSSATVSQEKNTVSQEKNTVEPSGGRQDDPRDTTGPLRIDEFESQTDEFSVGCPVCGTRISATPAQIGLAINCPDCHSPVPILPRGAAPARANQPGRSEAGYELSEPVVPPRYTPQPGAGVSANELYVEPPVGAPPSADENKDHLREFSVACPVCHTRVSARASQIGQDIRCPDCETAFTVRAPRQAPKQSLTLDGSEFELSDVVERPKYQSTSTRGTISRDDLDIVEFFEPAAAPPAKTPASPATASGKIDFFVSCPTCGSKVGARVDQVDQMVRCSDCLTDVLVKAPRGATFPKTPTNPGSAAAEVAEEPEPPPVAIVPTPPPVDQATAVAEWVGERTTDVMEGVSRDAIARAELEAAEQEAEIKLDKLPPFQQIFSILADPGVLFRIIWMSAIVLLELTLLRTYLDLSGLSAAFAPVIVLFMVGLGLPLVAFGCSAVVAIVEATAVGQVRIETWSDSIYDSLWPMLQVIVAISISMLPGFVLMSVTLSLGLVPQFSILFMPLSLFLFFPFVFLSVLEGEHPFHVISPVVAKSIPDCLPAWIRYYCEAFVLLLALWGLELLTMTDSFLLRAVVSIGLLAVAALYLRSVGVLAFYCNRALMKVVPAPVEQVAE